MRFDRELEARNSGVGERGEGRGDPESQRVCVRECVSWMCVQCRVLDSQLYEALFERAARAGHDRIVCEVNASPPNPESEAFHLALGFSTVGVGQLPERGKTVRDLERRLVVPGP